MGARFKMNGAEYMYRLIVPLDILRAWCAARCFSICGTNDEIYVYIVNIYSSLVEVEVAKVLMLC